MVDDDKLVGSGLLTNLDLTETGTNQVGVVFVGDTGWLFINNSLVTDLDLSDVTGAGDIRVITGVHGETDMRSGFATNFGAFQIVRPSLILKKSLGALAKLEGKLATWVTPQKLLNSYSTVTITNPYGPPKYWSYGLMFRTDNGMGMVVVHSKTSMGGNWDLSYRSDAANSVTKSVITYGTASNLKMNVGESNKLGLMVIDNVGVLYLNDQKVSEFDLTAISGTGQSGVASGWYGGDEWEPIGTVTEFEDLNVWSLGD
jgi:hypothetical protein